MFAVLLHDEPFSWTRWPIHPSTVIGCAFLLFSYYLGIGVWRARYGWGEKPSKWRPFSYSVAVALIFVSLNGPLHELADEYLFSAHMIQHLLLTLLMPPLLLLGCPDWLLRALIRRTVGFRVARFLVHPLLAFAMYNVVFAAWHLPVFYEMPMENHNIHIVEHLMFMVTAVIMWWPVVDPLPELSRIPVPMRLVYLFAQSIPMSIVSALIALSENVLYQFYARAPRVSGLSALQDQQLGGLIMWVPGSLVFWGAISIVYYLWAQEENREEAGHRIMLGGSPT